MGLSEILPPALRDALLYCARGITGFTGPINSWSKGLRGGFGYDNPKLHLSQPLNPNEGNFSNILNQREIRLAFSIQTAISQIGHLKKIRVLDFGGAGGNHYQLFSRLIGNKRLDYTIVESTPMVEKYRKFATDNLRWVNEIPDSEFEISLCSASIQYVESPLPILQRIIEQTKFVILDRLSVQDGEENLLMKQNYFAVNTGRVSYPCWYFSESKFLSETLGKTEILYRWDVPEDSPWILGKRRPNIGLLVRPKP